MPITQAGALNTTALVVPDLYVQIVPPAVANLNGVPTNVLGIVGTAAWGPVNKSTIIGTMADYGAAFGPVQNRLFDMGTHVALAVLQGASNFRCVRVSDGTDKAATAEIGTTPDISFAALYTGSLGNELTLTLAPGGKANAWNLIVSLPGGQPEQFANITGTGAGFWQAVANAINNGTGPLRGPSQYITASIGTGSDAPTAQTVTFSGGTDGAANVTAQMLLGQNVTGKTGMYCLSGTGCCVAVLADVTDPTTFTTQTEFGLAQGMYMVGALQAGTSVGNAVALMQTNTPDSYGMKVMHGDWLYWYDPVNLLYRLVSPAAFAAGKLVALSPEQSSLNKPLYGIVGSQSFGLPGTATASPYAEADLQSLFEAGLDVITNPIPAGPIWGVRGGFNSSLSADVNGDNYTRMTNYIAATLNGGMGVYVGQLINSDLFQNIRATLLSFLGNMLGQGLLGSTDGKLPYSVVCDLTNNPASRTGLGYVQADVQVRYQAINKKFIVNLEGGQTVTITQQTGV